MHSNLFQLQPRPSRYGYTVGIEFARKWYPLSGFQKMFFKTYRVLRDNNFKLTEYF